MKVTVTIPPLPINVKSSATTKFKRHLWMD